MTDSTQALSSTAVVNAGAARGISLQTVPLRVILFASKFCMTSAPKLGAEVFEVPRVRLFSPRISPAPPKDAAGLAATAAPVQLIMPSGMANYDTFSVSARFGSGQSSSNRKRLAVLAEAEEMSVHLIESLSEPSSEWTTSKGDDEGSITVKLIIGALPY